MEVVEEALGSVTQMDVSSPTASIPLRSSARVSKKKLDSLNKVLSPAPVEKQNEKGEPPEEAEKTLVKKPTLWPVEEKKWFFEAVNIYGKDFAAIHRYFVMKSKNQPTPVRTKDQIRRFYRKTWRDISPNLHFPSHIPKQTQELYGLINYGELRKKCKGRTKKDMLRLNELIIRGFTLLRGKNKTMVIRTPRCRVLRNLCKVEENQESETKLPSSVRVELLPIDNHTWVHVQGLAQNPRINLHVPLQCRLMNLIQYLQRRWSHRHNKYKLKLMEGLDSDPGVNEPKEILVLTAKPNAEVHVPQVNPTNFNSQTKICLSSYEERIGWKGESLEILNKLYLDQGTKVKRQKTDSVTEKEVKLEVKEDVVTGQSTQGDVGDVKKEDSCFPENGEPQTSSEELNTEVNDMEKVIEAVVSAASAHDEGLSRAKEETDHATGELLARIREGWTLENVGTLTVGELYLMVGNDCKLQLDYQLRGSTEAGSVAGAASTLSRLVRLAALSRTRPTIHCPCRHQCPESKRPRKDSNHEDATISAQLSADAAFRRPSVHSGNRRAVPGPPRLDAESFRAQMHKLAPKYCNRRGRGISLKQVVVQRTLLPNAPNGSPAYTLKVLPQQVIQPCEPAQTVPSEVVSSSNTCAVKTVEPSVKSDCGAVTGVEPTQQPPQPEPPPSPTPSIQTILNEESFKPFTGACELSGTADLCSSTRQEWLSEVGECSLSSLLGHLDTPTTTPSKPPTSNDSFEPTPPDVETHFQYLMTEASLDFTAKFAALAAQVTSDSSH